MYTYIERERDRERDVCVCMCVHLSLSIYIYIYTYRERDIDWFVYGCVFIYCIRCTIVMPYRWTSSFHRTWMLTETPIAILSGLFRLHGEFTRLSRLP